MTRRTFPSPRTRAAPPTTTSDDNEDGAVVALGCDAYFVSGLIYLQTKLEISNALFEKILTLKEGMDSVHVFYLKSHTLESN
ncbi:hypothetical protein [Alcaligenes aquatilis]|uniref:Uncharacterized protein n=1 Tax=Alcaligenes aquatilis TaxID=323284 RepID=A0A3G2HUV7_9BURK|nr:hypothetical protein [Alcaligenes aquatilis]AYN20817.1 hypothetical protein D3M96_09945 [Alcaligenes aquatilis]